MSIPIATDRETTVQTTFDKKKERKKKRTKLLKGEDRFKFLFSFVKNH